jgi:hypothetical protein
LRAAILDDINDARRPLPVRVSTSAMDDEIPF